MSGKTSLDPDICTTRSKSLRLREAAAVTREHHETHATSTSRKCRRSVTFEKPCWLLSDERTSGVAPFERLTMQAVIGLEDWCDV